MWKFLVGFALLSVIIGVKGDEGRALVPGEGAARRFDYRMTFKKPFFFVDNKTIPHFNSHGGLCPLFYVIRLNINCKKSDVILSQEYIRLTPSVKASSGSIWSSVPNKYANWEVDFSFRVGGRNKIGGDGLAFWYAKDPGIIGPAFGSKDTWDGLGVIFDTYDNDGKVLLLHYLTTSLLLNCL